MRHLSLGLAAIFLCAGAQASLAEDFEKNKKYPIDLCHYWLKQKNSTFVRVNYANNSALNMDIYFVDKDNGVGRLKYQKYKIDLVAGEKCDSKMIFGSVPVAALNMVHTDGSKKLQYVIKGNELLRFTLWNDNSITKEVVGVRTR